MTRPGLADPIVQYYRMTAGRSIGRLWFTPPSDTPLRLCEESLSRAALWVQFRGVQENAETAQSLLSGSLRERPSNWTLLRNFLRQARLNDDAAQYLHGSSAALLHYYTSLNLAKAILITVDPSAIAGQTVRHGLSYNPSKASKHTADYVTVQSGGIFDLLYRHVTGSTLKGGTRLPIRRLLRQVFEIGQEVTEVGFGVNNAWPLVHLTAADAPVLQLNGLRTADGAVHSRPTGKPWVFASKCRRAATATIARVER